MTYLVRVRVNPHDVNPGLSCSLDGISSRNILSFALYAGMPALKQKTTFSGEQNQSGSSGNNDQTSEKNIFKNMFTAGKNILQNLSQMLLVPSCYC
jgi:hypothetical protein